MSGRTPAGDVLTDVVMRTFRLYGALLDAAEEMTRPVGLTAAWWQVLGAVLRTPLPVSGIAREMSLARQSVQRIADLLVDKGLAEYRPNPAHRRAKLLSPTEAGYAAIAGLREVQHAWTKRITAGIDVADLRTTLSTMEKLVAALDADRDT
ncbi:MarR family transcriptional regulator [Saccharothrix violaceirubra]|uniref:DNA-binding MarR family transcriptional regulator n=1 Tax=Saccharothrix violaceirubra TaxID=413306 RepID=A0A7W7WYN3_9PSEU|nr:MarR family transcriptional regulator [Saccharothrix violaceirubra]MBB4967893.1 DNA-binding MarR family transcriptional regulator [Saccharothrix violaceirubra]